MKKIIPLALGIFSLCHSFAQDTTSTKLIGATVYDGGIQFYADDTTDFPWVETSIDATYHALFINPADSLLYAIIDEVGSSGDRNLYQVNPFTGVITLVHDITADYINTADLGNDNILYMSQGFGAGGTGGEVYTLDLTTFTETFLYNSSITDAKALEFNPVDSSLYLYQAFLGPLYVYDLASGSESTLSYTGPDDEFHGAYYDEAKGIFYISGYGGEIHRSDASYLNITNIYTSASTNMDICELDYTLKAASDTMEICPNDSTLIHLIYEANSVVWYHNGIALAETNDSIYVSLAGTYQAAIEIGGSGNYFWSEPIVVENFTIPNVNITQTEDDSLICPGETITLNGASGGTLQWFLNGVAIAGATGNSYDATTVGIYNQLKTNMSGCSDSSATGFEIYPDPACSVAVENFELNINVFPNPFESIINIYSNSRIVEVYLYGIKGELIKKFAVNQLNSSINLGELEAGMYLLVVQTEFGQKTIKLNK